MDTRDLTIIAQNSGQHAATVIAAALHTDTPIEQALADFESARAVIFNGALELAGTSTEAVAAAEAERATARVGGAFPGTTSESSGPARQAAGARLRVLKPLEGHPIPDWLEPQFDAAVAAGKIEPDDTEVWDNRKFLPQFGKADGNANSPWFKTKRGKQGIWPPKDGA